MSDHLKWERLSSKYLVKEKWATLRVDECKMPDGRIVDDYYVLEYPDWANAVALTEDQQVILIKQYRHGSGEVILEIPGGCIDDGESPEDAIRRELMEETGYSFESVELVSTVYANPSTAANKTWCYLAKGGKKIADQQLDGREEIEVLRVSIPELKQLLFDNKIGQALHTSAIFYALHKLGEFN